MANVTRELARFAVTSQYEKLPQEIQREGLRAFVNFIGCAAGGVQEEGVTKMIATMEEFNGKNDSVIVGHSKKLDALNAALINSLSSAALAFNDTHYATVAHPTSPVGAALLAVAQRQKISGKELVHAVILGDEIQCRVGNIICTPPAECAVGLSMAGLVGCIGAAVAAGKAMGFNEDQMTTAIGIAANQSAGLREAHATMSSPFTPGNAGRAGLWAALLAAHGFTCADTMIEGVKGFAVSFGQQPQMDAALEGLGKKWEISDLAYKPYPCGFVIHPVVDACLEIARKHTYDHRQIERVELKVNPLCVQLCNRPAPKLRSQAMVSFQQWAAACLIHKAASLPQMTDAMIHDPDMTALRAKIVAASDDALSREAAHVRVVMKNGDALEARCEHARGTASRPMTDTDISDKTQLQLELVFAKDKARRIVDDCWSIAAVQDAAPFCASLAA